MESSILQFPCTVQAIDLIELQSGIDWYYSTYYGKNTSRQLNDLVVPSVCRQEADFLSFVLLESEDMTWEGAIVLQGTGTVLTTEQQALVSRVNAAAKLFFQLRLRAENQPRLLLPDYRSALKIITDVRDARFTGFGADRSMP